jgi:hypothetical protein
MAVIMEIPSPRDLVDLQGRARAQAVSRRLRTVVARVRVRVRSCGIWVDELALGKVFSEYFGSPRQSFHRQLRIHHPGLVH